jgi:hypothetical protein
LIQQAVSIINVTQAFFGRDAIYFNVSREGPSSGVASKGPFVWSVSIMARSYKYLTVHLQYTSIVIPKLKLKCSVNFRQIHMWK